MKTGWKKRAALAAMGLVMAVSTPIYGAEVQKANPVANTEHGAFLHDPKWKETKDPKGISFGTNYTVTLSKTTFVYNGKYQKPSVTVKDSKGNVLRKGRDYTVSYSRKSKEVGNYTVTVKVKGKNRKNIQKTYRIISRR
ncbi:MAG: MBG domain-containing protein [Lachnospiraceae bacterium]